MTFQSERLLPADDRGRPRILLLFSNAHPESIKNGMFHTAEGGIAALWTDLCLADLFSGDCRIIGNADQLRAHCVRAEYEGPFAFGLACYWLFPTFDPSHLKPMFGSRMEPPGFEQTKQRFDRLLEDWKPAGIICFNKIVFKQLTDGDIGANVIERLRNDVIRSEYRTRDRAYPIFLTYPAGWRFDPNAGQLRQASLRRIAGAIQSSLR